MIPLRLSVHVRNARHTRPEAAWRIGAKEVVRRRSAARHVARAHVFTLDPHYQKSNFRPPSNWYPGKKVTAEKAVAASKPKPALTRSPSAKKSAGPSLGGSFIVSAAKLLAKLLLQPTYSKKVIMNDEDVDLEKEDSADPGEPMPPHTLGGPPNDKDRLRP